MFILEDQAFDLDLEKVAGNSRHRRKGKVTWPHMIYGSGGWKGRKTSKLVQYFIFK